MYFYKECQKYGFNKYHSFGAPALTVSEAMFLYF